MFNRWVLLTKLRLSEATYRILDVTFGQNTKLLVICFSVRNASCSKTAPTPVTPAENQGRLYLVKKLPVGPRCLHYDSCDFQIN